MQKQIAQLREFHEVFDHHAPERPTLDGYPYELRTRLIVEEAIEFADACGFYVEATSDGWALTRNGEPDHVLITDAGLDLLYVVFGAFVSMGLTGDQVVQLFDEVHRSNMAKRGGGKDAAGKSLKPAGWQPPRLREMLEEMLRGPA